MEVEIPHDEVIQVVLIGVVALVEHDKVELLHAEEAVHEEVVELLGHADEHIVGSEFVGPGERLLEIAGLFLAAVVAAHY